MSVWSSETSESRLFQRARNTTFLKDALRLYHAAEKQENKDGARLRAGTDSTVVTVVTLERCDLPQRLLPARAQEGTRSKAVWGGVI